MRDSHVPSVVGYQRGENLFHELARVAEALATQSDETHDAGDDISAGQLAHEANCVAFAAAELRKSCASCANWQFPNDWEPQECLYAGRRMMPVDGSGYCRPGWEAK